MKIISTILIFISVYVGGSHSYTTLSRPASPKELEMMAALGVSPTIRLGLGIASLVAAILMLFPHTFFTANLLRAQMLVFMMAIALRGSNLKLALLEVPFLLMALALLYLGHPLKK